MSQSICIKRPSHARARTRISSLIALSFGLSACALSDLASEDFDKLTATPETIEHIDVDSALAQGLKALSEGRAIEAQENFSRILRIEPESTEATLGLAESYLSLGQGSEALALFTQLESDPAHKSQAIQGQGLAHYRNGERGLARERLQLAVGVDPTLWRTWNALGQLSDAEEAWDEAATAYQNAIENNPRAASPYNNDGMSLLMQGKLEAALARFSEALRINPDFSTAQTNRQICLSMMGRYEDALQGTPKSQRYIALNNIGYIAMTRGDLKKARYYFNLSAEESPSYYEKAEENLQKVEHLLSGPSAALD